MSIKILTKTGEEVTHIDDARAYNFDAGNRSGIVKGAYNEGRFFAVSNNVIGLDSCELRIAGHRVIIDSAESITLTNTPADDTRYSMIAEIVVNDSSTPSFRLFIQASTTSLIKDNLYKTAKGNGTYQLEIGRFTLTASGVITDVIRTADVITGGGNGSLTDIEFNATAYDLDSNKQPEVNVDFNEETKKYDMSIGIPRGQNGLNGSGINPNLLINGDFRVNQRGKTTYNELDKYTVDRWKLVSGTVEVVSGGIMLNGSIVQKLEHTPTLPVVASSNNGEITYSNGAVTIRTTTATLITYAKLEIGSIATAFSPRPYAEELAMCQRYYQLRNNTGLIGTTSSVTYIAVSFQYICEMRIKPTLIHLNPVTMRNSGVNYTQTTATANAFYGDNKSTLISLTTFVNNPTNVLYIAQANQNVFAFDAEIY